MASIQEPCTVRLYALRPNGDKDIILQQDVSQLAPAGGAPDGARSSVSTPEKLLVIDSDVVMKNDDILIVTVEPDSAGDGVDASDCVWSIPLVTSKGTKALNRSSFANPTFADSTLVAGEQTIAGYRIVEGEARLSGKIYLDIQDNTA